MPPGNVLHSADGLRRVGDHFETPKQTVSGARRFLQKGLANLGRPWGDDEFGKPFGEKFEPSMANLLKVLGDVEDGLTEFQSTFYSMGKTVEEAEESHST